MLNITFMINLLIFRTYLETEMLIHYKMPTNAVIFFLIETPVNLILYRFLQFRTSLYQKILVQNIQ